MEESITRVIEKNAVVRDWSFRTQKVKGDSLKEGYTSDLPERVTSNVRQNDLEDLTRIWKQWDSDTRSIFTKKYGDIAHLIAINVNEQLIQAMYAALLRIDNVQLNKIYVKEPKPMTFKKKLMKLTRMTDTWAEKQIKKKNEINCLPWFSFWELVQNHPDTLRRTDLFALAIYGLVIFPKVLGHIEVAVVDFFEKQRRVKSQLTSPIGVACQNPFSEEIPSELDLARHKIEREKAKLLRDISSLQEENYQLKIDVQIEKSRIEKVQKEVEVTRKDLRDLHLENKKLRGTIRNSGLGKSSVEWKEKISNIKGGMGFWNAKAKKEEERAARAMIELRKNVEYETVSAELIASQSERQELKGRIRNLESTLQTHQQHLDDLLKALEEKNGQHDRDIRAYERALQEKDMHLGSLINEIRKAAEQIVQLSDEDEALSCQYPPNQRSSISEFLERIKK
ncbi:hypothetical protein V6Z12_D08G227700 [Gossypium hirsutum]